MRHSDTEQLLNRASFSEHRDPDLQRSGDIGASDPLVALCVACWLCLCPELRAQLRNSIAQVTAQIRKSNSGQTLDSAALEVRSAPGHEGPTDFMLPDQHDM